MTAHNHTSVSDILTVIQMHLTVYARNHSDVALL